MAARFELKAPAYIANEYLDASPRNPLIYDLPKGAEPSRTWTPINEEAAEMLRELQDLDIKKEQAARNPEKYADQLPMRKKEIKVAKPSDMASAHKNVAPDAEGDEDMSEGSGNPDPKKEWKRDGAKTQPPKDGLKVDEAHEAAGPTQHHSAMKHPHASKDTKDAKRPSDKDV